MQTTVRVLLVDDEETSYVLLRRMLGKVPGKTYVTDWASGYGEGLTALMENRHDVCLLDYRLGSRTGLEVLRDAVAKGVQTPIIILTGQDVPQVDMEAAQLGAADFLLKDQLEPVMLERVIRYSIQQAAAVKALQKSHEHFRLLFERSMDAILVSNDRDEFVEVNGAACRLLGSSREELLTKNWNDILARTTQPDAPSRSERRGELALKKPNGDRCFIEFTSAQLSAELNLSMLRDVTERRNLEREIQEISEREQRRLGQDLHDGLGQSLTGIAFLAKVLQQKLSAKGMEESEAAGNIAALINEALAETRRLSRGLCPVILDGNDIEAALEQLAENVRSMFGVACELDCEGEIKIADNTVAMHLYRIAQEAATNAIKHGQAKSIILSLTVGKSRLILKVKDDGVGFAPKTAKGKGMGLRVMQHRCRMIGATLSLRAPKEGGVTVICSLPKGQALQKSGGRAEKLLAPDAPAQALR
ncbi:MAG: response regulator [Limisphaerales bacterium]